MNDHLLRMLTASLMGVSLASVFYSHRPKVTRQAFK